MHPIAPPRRESGAGAFFASAGALDLRWDLETTWELTLTGPGPVTVSGRYSDLALAAEVSARAGSQGVQTLGADGRFQVVLPGDGPLTWTLTVSDPASRSPWPAAAWSGRSTPCTT